MPVSPDEWTWRETVESGTVNVSFCPGAQPAGSLTITAPISPSATLTIALSVWPAFAPGGISIVAVTIFSPGAPAMAPKIEEASLATCPAARQVGETHFVSCYAVGHQMVTRIRQDRVLCAS